jgi:hypothetical protein
MLSVIYTPFCAECRYAECHYAERLSSYAISLNVELPNATLPKSPGGEGVE